MPQTLAIALAQLNPTVGDIAGNAEKVRRARAEAAAGGADIVLFSELFLAGYPPEDLVLKPAFLAACRAAIEALARETADGGPALIVGTPWVEAGQLSQCGGGARWRRRSSRCGSRSTCRTMACSTRSGCSCRGRCRSRSNCAACASACRSARISGGPSRWRTSPRPAPRSCWCRTARPIAAPSPSSAGRWWRRASRESGLPLVYLNQVGGQDELVFDGASFVLNADRAPAVQLAAFAETVALTRWTKTATGWRCWQGPNAGVPAEDEANYAACVLGLRDYVDKNRLSRRGAGAVGRHRLGAVRGDGGRRAGARARALRDAALSLHLQPVAVGRRRHRHPAGRALRHRADRPGGRGAGGGAAAAVRRPAARRDGGKPPVARPRHHPDVGLQQVRRRWW